MPALLSKLASAVVAAVVAFAVFVYFDATARKKVSPSTTLLRCILDSFCVIPKALKLGPWAKPFTFSSAISQAKEITKLTDMGPYEASICARYDTALKIGLAKSKMKISPLGDYFLLRTNRLRMETRLKLIQYMKQHPEVSSISINKPVFVIGFPRTGTTFLHELLGLHPEVRMHYTWEQMHPMPAAAATPATMAADRKQRYEKAKMELKFNLLVAGDAIQSIHRIGIDEPEECTTPCAMALPWNIVTIAFITFAARELATMGCDDAFSQYKNFLRIISHQTPELASKTWMLKCPFHLPYLSELFAEFPDATVVWTHRDPAQCIASACSLYYTLLAMIAEEHTIDKHALGAAVMDYTKLSLEKALDTIEHNSSVHVIHVRYADNIKAPKDICKNVVEKASLPYSSEYNKELDTYLAANKAKREAMKAQKATTELHSYSLEEYGLSKAVVHEKFKDYIAKFNLLE